MKAIITSNIGFVVTEDDERLGVFETRPQAEWFARTGETLNAAEAARRIFEMSQQTNYVAAVCAANRQVWDGINNLIELQRQWTALDYGNTLQPDDLTAAEVGAVVFDTANAMVAVLNAGHATNMARLL